MVEAEIGYLGAMKKSEIDAATKEFVDYILKLDGEGAITLKKDAEEYI
jgi:flagellar motor switch protein FliG